MTDVQIEKANTNGRAMAPPRWRVTPGVDVYESETEYLVQLDVPGATADSIDVQVVGTDMYIRAAQAASDADAQGALATFERHIELPTEVDTESASAQLNEGVLEIRIAKSPSARRVKIPVSVN
jgi:HSP20 family protein